MATRELEAIRGRMEGAQKCEGAESDDIIPLVAGAAGGTIFIGCILILCYRSLCKSKPTTTIRTDYQGKQMAFSPRVVQPAAYPVHQQFQQSYPQTPAQAVPLQPQPQARAPPASGVQGGAPPAYDTQGV